MVGVWKYVYFYVLQWKYVLACGEESALIDRAWIDGSDGAQYLDCAMILVPK